MVTAYGRRPALHALLVSAALCICHPACAQETAGRGAEAPPAATAVADKQIYLPAEFAQFAPRTAMDLLARVPGFRFQYASGERGLGQATENVLLNGQRVTNKTGGAIGELGRMSAKQVERIEIVDAASLDIAGLTGQVANVITKAESKGSGQFAWYPEFNAHYGDPSFTHGNISYSGKKGRVNYTLGLDSGGYSSSSDGPTLRYDAAGQLIENRDEVSRSKGDFPKASTRLALDGPVSGSLNLSYQYDRNVSTDVSNRMPLAGPSSVGSFEYRSRGSNFEAGGDLSFKLAGGRLKLIGLIGLHDSPSLYSGLTLTQGAPATGSKVEDSGSSGETVGRVEYGLKWGGADIQLSGEAAYNRLNGASRLFELDAAGGYAEIPFPGATLKVEEDRYEILATIGRNIAKGLTLQLVAGGEHSTLSAGPVSRDFLRYKGSASLAWQAGKRTAVSLKLARVVEQLYFGQFLASINLVDNRQTAGNVTLVPPQTWKADLELNRNLNAWGSTQVRLYALRTEDIVETIPIGNGGQALGNVDHAGRFGMEWQNTLLFDPIGLKGARLNTSLFVERTRVRDPLTGVPRSISYNMTRRFSASLRHDIDGSKLAWGCYVSSYAAAPGVQLTEVSRNWRDALQVGAYVEHKDLLGLTVRADMSNVADAHNRRERTVYDGWRTDPVLFREVQDRRVGATFSFGVSGSF